MGTFSDIGRTIFSGRRNKTAHAQDSKKKAARGRRPQVTMDMVAGRHGHLRSRRGGELDEWEEGERHEVGAHGLRV